MKSIIILCFIGIATATLSTDSDKSIETPCPPKNQFGEIAADQCCGNIEDCEIVATSRIVDDNGIGKYDEFIKYTNEYLTRSYEYFFLAAQFGTYAKERPGFEKLLSGLSDSAWNKGIEMIKEITKRGFSHKFILNKETATIMSSANVTELVAIAKAAEIEKSLLVRANDIHRHHSHASLDASHSCGYDAGLSHYIAEEIMEEKTETVRTLTGHANQLKRLFAQDPKLYPLSLFMFDKHLQ
ncbi:hypothetical protein PVAND_002692 [Polypedilum vanderplanki]|uniref:Ferritin n=1 Tax=Polypedilum vanderplanki TaxID=319348 RepID=A0A9J6BRY0_POLVA|nr:hypothetical protein PVAND_002692 [Polypedilum vanderplanki]